MDGSLKEKIFLWGERRRGSISVTRCLLGSHCCSVSYHRLNAVRKKRCGSEQARDFFIAISLCFDQKDLILALSLYHFRPHFTSVSLSIWAQSRKLTANVTNLVDKSTQWIFISNDKIEILYFLINLKPQVSFSFLGVSAMSLVTVFGSP